MSAGDGAGRVKGSTVEWNRAEGTASAPEAPRPPAVGRLPAGWRYVLLEELGRGGMGVVHAAYDRELGRRVALKLVHLRADSTLARERLLREAQALAQLTHRNVVTVYDAGTHDGEVFVAMELVAGEPLRAWLGRRPRGWREIAATFLEAGRGLAAAHAAGLVHRDFKPDNVLVGEDGAVRVVDFGLARAAEDDDLPADLPSGERLALSLTRAGAVVGTPVYLAPEALRGERADARTDQYAFGASLHEALTGSLPFQGSTPRELLEAIDSSDAPAATRAPRWLRAIVARALARDPAARFPSMAALLAALDRRPARRRRQMLTGGAALAVIAAALLYAARRGPDVACRPAPSAWSDEAQKATAAAFAATGRGWAVDSARSTTALLDGYAARLAAGERAACLAVARHEQTPQLAELRASCLARRRADLAALVELLRAADADMVDHAARAAGALSDVEACDDAAWLLGPATVPHDAAVAAEVAAVRDVLSRGKALNDSGRFAQAVPIAREAERRAAAVGYRPLQAEALFYLSASQEQSGDVRGAERTLRDAVLAAEAGRHDEMVARAAGALAMNVGSLQARLEEGWSWAQLGLAAVERMGWPALHEARARFYVGMLTRARGDLVGAEREIRRAIQLYERQAGPDSLLLAGPLNALAGVMISSRRLDESERLYRRAYEITLRVEGDHPDLGTYLGNLGLVAEERGDDRRAVEIYRDLLARRERWIGPDHPRTADTAVMLARTQTRVGAFDEAVASGRRSVATLARVVGSDSARTQRARLTLAQALLAAGAVDESRALAAQASAGFERAGSADDLLDSLIVEGDAALAAGDAGAATARYERVTQLAAQSGAVGPTSLYAAEALCRAAEAWRARGDARRAEATAERCFPLLSATARRPTSLARGLLALGAARLAAGHPAGAWPPLEGALAILSRAPEEHAAAAAARRALAQRR